MKSAVKIIVKHPQRSSSSRPVNYQIIKQKQSVNNMLYASASFCSEVSITMMKNKLFKLANNQSTKQVSIIMKKKLFKRDNNQRTKHASIAMQSSRIVDCNLTKNKLTLRNFPSAQNTRYKTTFLSVPSSGAFCQYTNATKF